MVWRLNASRGNTPMVSRRVVDFYENAPAIVRLNLESDTHIVTGSRNHPNFAALPSLPVGSAFIHRNLGSLPRVRLVGKPKYVDNRLSAIAALKLGGASLQDHLVVEDPDRPLAVNAEVTGKARIVEEVPERVVVETDASMPSYLVLSDTFDPGWSAMVDGRPAPIRPAYVAFRAVYLPEGTHRVVFSYRPAGFELGLVLSALGVIFALFLWFRPRWTAPVRAEHAVLSWLSHWRIWWFASLALIVLASAVTVGPTMRPEFQARWKNSLHGHTWGAGIAASKENRM